MSVLLNYCKQFISTTRLYDRADPKTLEREAIEVKKVEVQIPGNYIQTVWILEITLSLTILVGKIKTSLSTLYRVEVGLK